mmetsp:Transcript_20321/g.30562  ORF Transcript_20321/g.30562 Transcript_20321/m.30562 type:complete len:82 (+) Transcript_20321:1047-1292(+)
MKDQQKVLFMPMESIRVDPRPQRVIDAPVDHTDIGTERWTFNAVDERKLNQSVGKKDCKYVTLSNHTNKDLRTYPGGRCYD